MRGGACFPSRCCSEQPPHLPAVLACPSLQRAGEEEGERSRISRGLRTEEEVSPGQRPGPAEVSWSCWERGLGRAEGPGDGSPLCSAWTCLHCGTKGEIGLGHGSMRSPRRED